VIAGAFLWETTYGKWTGGLRFKFDRLYWSDQAWRWGRRTIDSLVTFVTKEFF